MHVGLSAESAPFTETRLEIRGEVKYLSNDRKAADQIVASFEVYDTATGKTLTDDHAPIEDITRRMLASE